MGLKSRDKTILDRSGHRERKRWNRSHSSKGKEKIGSETKGFWGPGKKNTERVDKVKYWKETEQLGSHREAQAPQTEPGFKKKKKSLKSLTNGLASLSSSTKKAQGAAKT